MSSLRHDDCVCIIASAYPKAIGKNATAVFLYFSTANEFFDYFESISWPERITVRCNSFAEMLYVSSRLELVEHYCLEIKLVGEIFEITGNTATRLQQEPRYFGSRFWEIINDSQLILQTSKTLKQLDTPRIDGNEQELQALRVRLAQAESRLKLHEARVRKIKTIPGAKFIYTRLRKVSKLWPLTK